MCQRVLDSQHTLHQIEVERGHTGSLPSRSRISASSVGQSMFSIRVTRSPIGGAKRQRLLLLQGRGWDHSRLRSAPCGRRSAPWRACRSRPGPAPSARVPGAEVFHRQGALSEVEVEVLNLDRFAEVRADEFLPRSGSPCSRCGRWSTRRRLGQPEPSCPPNSALAPRHRPRLRGGVVNKRCGRSNRSRSTPGMPSSVRRTSASSLRQSMLLTWKTVVSVLACSLAHAVCWPLPPEQAHGLEGSLFIDRSSLTRFSRMPSLENL